MFNVDEILLTETVSDAGFCQLDIKSPNGLHYIIIDNVPDNQHTYLKLTYHHNVVFEFPIDKFREDSVFDTTYFKNTQHHYLFRMDIESLKLFLEDTQNLIYIPYSVGFEHYLFIGAILYQLDFASNQLNYTTSSSSNNQRWIYTYREIKESSIARIVDTHSIDRYTVDNFPRRSHFYHYMIVGDHFQLLGVFNGHFQDLFSIRYSPKTLELHLHSFSNGYSYLTNQTADDMNRIMKNEFYDWLDFDGTQFIKAMLKDLDFKNMAFKDALTIMEMAVI